MAFFPRLKIVSFQRVFHWQRWELSEDGKFLLIVHDTIQIFRHSSLAKYTIVSLKDRYMQQSFERKIEGIIKFRCSSSDTPLDIYSFMISLLIFPFSSA